MKIIKDLILSLIFWYLKKFENEEYNKILSNIEFLKKLKLECRDRMINGYILGTELEKAGITFNEEYYKSKKFIEETIIIEDINIEELFKKNKD